jgi:hypothetical protein
MLATLGEAMIDYSGLPDRRLGERLKTVVDSFIRQPGASIPQASGSVEAAKAAYRFFDNKRVTHKALIGAQGEATWSRVKKEKPAVLIVAQDTTSLDYSSHKETSGLGVLESEYSRGLFMHSSLAISEQGVPWGLVGQQLWTRPVEALGKRHSRKQRVIEDKESSKWLKGIPEIAETVSAAGTQVVMVSDRESDVYEVLQACSDRPGLDGVIRVSWDRALANGEGRHLFETVHTQTPQHSYTLRVQGTAKRTEREALVEVRFTTLTLNPPSRPAGSPKLQPLAIGLVEVIEVQPPANEPAVHWLLYTTLPLNTVEDALTVIRYYTYRWLIERFHFTLKSGCLVEERQLQTEPRLERLLAVFSLVAWSLLWLTYQARLTPNAPASLALTASEWHALSAYINRTTQPATEPTLHQAVRWIAQLGGFLGRRSDGEPGVKVLWRGWQRLQDITQTWHLFHPAS